MITLKTLPDATEQEVFDQVALHMLKQGRKATDVAGCCRYKAGELKCAAGCLIADDEYNPMFEGSAWSVLVGHNSVTPAHYYLIFSLQLIHDNKDVVSWAERLKSLAKEMYLSTAVIDTFKSE